MTPAIGWVCLFGMVAFVLLLMACEHVNAKRVTELEDKIWNLKGDAGEYKYLQLKALRIMKEFSPDSFPDDWDTYDPGLALSILWEHLREYEGQEDLVESLHQDVERLTLALMDKLNAPLIEYDKFIADIDRLLQDINNEVNEHEHKLTDRKIAVLRAVRRVREFLQDRRGRYVIEAKDQAKRL